MVELFSVATRVLALFTFACQTISDLTTLSADLNSALYELLEISQDVHSLCRILLCLYETFIGDLADNPPAGQSIEELVYILTNCKATLAKVQEKASVTNRLRTGNFIYRFKYIVSWNSLKKEILELRIQVEAYKTAILL